MAREGELTKFTLFGLNTILLVCGIVLAVLGYLLESNIILRQASHPARSVPVVVIILGCIIFAASLLGCCVATRGEACFTMTYTVVMCIIFIAHLLLVGVFWWYRRDFLNEMQLSLFKISDTFVKKIFRIAKKYISKISNTFMNKMFETIKKLLKTPGKKTNMDIVQSSLKCCKFDKSWINTCCPAGVDSCTSERAFQQYCSAASAESFSVQTNIILYAGLCALVVEFVVLIICFSCANQKRNIHRRLNNLSANEQHKLYNIPY